MAAVGICLAAWAAGARTYRLAPAAFAVRPDTFAPLAGGHAASDVAARDAAGAVLADFPTAACGMTVSETGRRPEIGGCLAAPDGLDVDWAAFSKTVAAQPAFADGYVFFAASETNAARRLVVARAGSFSLDWPLASGVTRTVFYESAFPASVATYGLFWTSAPFNGSAVSIPSNYGVELHGDASLFYDVSHTNANGSGRYDYGVDYNAEAGVICAYATTEADGSVRGPKGVFVVAYYDSGRKERYLGCTVVSVGEPTPVELHATVGAEVLPQNEHYDPTKGIYSPDDRSAENASEGGDPRAPYFLVQKRIAGQYHAKENRVFAIAPTAPGRAGAKRATVNWQVADDFDVCWTLEQSYYHITWPECPTVVLAQAGSAPGVTVPDCYTPTFLDWQEPSGIARLDQGTVRISGAGRFTLKLANETQDDFCLVPLAAAYDTDATAFPQVTPVCVDVGREARPELPVEASEALRDLAAAVDTNLAAFVCEQMSPGRNWNPNLYHADASGETDDPFAALASSVWFVNVTAQPYDAELWWFRSYATAGMSEPLVLPVLPIRYKAAWPARDDVAELVFASGLGSAAGGRVSAGRALRLAETNAAGSVRFRYEPDADRAFTAAFAFRPTAAATAGEVLSFALGETRLAFAVKAPPSGGASAVCTFDLTKASFDVTCPTDRWTRFVVVAATNEVALYADGRLVTRQAADLSDAFASCSGMLLVGRDTTPAAACGAALDDVCAWNAARSADEIAASATNRQASALGRALLNVSFDDAEVADDGLVVAHDAASLRSFSGKGFAVRTPGAPAWTDGLFEVSDGVTPRAYVQNEVAKTGYRPNVEHALTLSEDGGYALYALRTDLNDESRPPYALVEYADGGRGAMRLFRVAMTNAWYAWPTASCVVGEKVSLFHPYDALPSGRDPDSEYVATAADDGTVTYRDHTGTWWARRDGAFGQRLRYFGEPGFVSGSGDDLEGVSLPAVDLANCFDWGSSPRVTLVSEASSDDTAVCRVGDGDGTPVGRRDRAWLLRQCATAVEARASWPSNAPVMSVAQVLSKPEDGLPDVYGMKTCAVAYPFYGYCSDAADDPERTTREALQKTYPNLVSAKRVVKLIDPTCRKVAEIPVAASFPDEYGFTLGGSGNLECRKGLYYFRGLPPNVADRLFVDVTSAGLGKAHLCLIGDYVDSAAGASYLRANSLAACEYAGITNVFASLRATAEGAVAANLATLADAVKKIYDRGDVQPSRQTGLEVKSASSCVIGNGYDSADHYALVAESDVPAGGEHVVLVENDGPGAESLPVSFHVLFVTNTLYCGKVVTVTDANNALSDQANVLYTAPLGKTADQYEFQWFATDAPADGHVPRVPDQPSPVPGSADAAWKSDSPEQGADRPGLTCVDAVAGANSAKVSAKALANRYWTMHYRVANATGAAANWSGWCAPTLVEGWVQRVLNAITPFAQRLRDLSQNRAELNLTALEQIGAPWEGDVALNDENLNNVGLVQLYQTILNRAESMSIAQGAATTVADTNAAVNKQLVECVARLADMYMTLGAEAYSDARNPTVSAPSTSTLPLGSVFCFANQVPSLLDEELALLRGRSYSVAPALTEAPFYNRLMWNFTKGVTQGEVAYVNNYNVKAVDGILDAAAAAKMYPQGHGDAYGHYLSALKGYYRLLRNPSFTWGEPSMMEMLVADHVVNMDYEEEDKFAECAHNLAKIGCEVVKMTALKQFRDNACDILSGYFDNPGTSRSPTLQASQTSLPQAFGYGEWACRAGYGALCNWAVANALLPPDATNAVSYFADASISNVTRQTAASLAPLGASVASLEDVVNAIDAGGNVLGFDSDDIPFREISAAEMQGLENGVGAVTPYEQMRAKAGEALQTAEAALAYANVYGSRLKAIEDDQQTLEALAAEQEASFERELVAVYGRPFADDIGPGKTYEQGYEGPDLYHYSYMNLMDYGLTNVASTEISVGTMSISNLTSATGITVGSLATIAADGKRIYQVTADGLVAMPQDWTGMRAAEGEVQTAYRNYLSAYVALLSARSAYETANSACSWALQSAKSTIPKVEARVAGVKENLQSIDKAQRGLAALKKILVAVNWVQSIWCPGWEASPSKDDINAYSVYIFQDEGSSESYLNSYLKNIGEVYSNVAKSLAADGAIAKAVNQNPYRPEDGSYDSLLNNLWSSADKIANSFNGLKQGSENLDQTLLNARNDTHDMITAIGEPGVGRFATILKNADEEFFTRLNSSLELLDDFERKRNAISYYQGKGENFTKSAFYIGTISYIKQTGSLIVTEGYGQEKGDGGAAAGDAPVAIDANGNVPVAVDAAAAKAVADAAKPDVIHIRKIAGQANTSIISEIFRWALFGSTVGTYTFFTTLGMSADMSVVHLNQYVSKLETGLSRLNLDATLYQQPLSAYNDYRSAAEAQNEAARAFQVVLAEYLARAQEYRTVLEKGAALQAERTRMRTRLANVATQRRYADMQARVSRNAALSRYRTAFDTAQRRVFELARLYDYETGLGAVGTPPGTGTFADAAVAARALGVRGVTGDGSVTDGGLWELVTRMDANYAQVKTQLGFNNPDVSERAFSLRLSNFRIAAGASGDRAWRQVLAKCWHDDVFAEADVAAHCQRPADAVGAQPGFVIPFETSIYLAKNFFGKTLKEGDLAYSSSAQGVKVISAGLSLSGYDRLVAPNGLAEAPDVYLVPLGADCQRLSDGTSLVERRFRVAATRLSTLRSDGSLTSRQLVARSVWNDRWVIVIPASSLHSDPRQAREIFLNGINGQSGVGDVKLLIRAYSRQ